MLIKLSELKPGDTYANKSYRVRDNDGQSIGVIRLADGWYLRFESNHPAFNKLVKKD